MQTFYDKTLFPFVSEFEFNHETIQAEYRLIKEKKIKWIEPHIFEGDWSVFGLFNWPDGSPIEENCKLCPFTSDLIHRTIPHHGAAGFSILQPNTTIKPHEGYKGPFGPFLRMHLGLNIPLENTALKILDTTVKWEVGKAIIFDDTFMHEAWNKSPSEERVVLLLDFKKYV